MFDTHVIQKVRGVNNTEWRHVTVPYNSYGYYYLTFSAQSNAHIKQCRTMK